MTDTVDLQHHGSCGQLLLLPAKKDVVVLMSDDCCCPPSYGALLACLQAVFTQLHSVVVAVTVGWQMTQCFHRGIRGSIDFSACVYDSVISLMLVEVIQGCVGDQTILKWLFGWLRFFCKQCVLNSSACHFLFPFLFRQKENGLFLLLPKTNSH